MSRRPPCFQRLTQQFRKPFQMKTDIPKVCVLFQREVNVTHSTGSLYYNVCRWQLPIFQQSLKDLTHNSQCTISTLLVKEIVCQFRSTVHHFGILFFPVFHDNHLLIFRDNLSTTRGRHFYFRCLSDAYGLKHINLVKRSDQLTPKRWNSRH